jgi:hypothetical protein
MEYIFVAYTEGQIYTIGHPVRGPRLDSCNYK